MFTRDALLKQYEWAHNSLSIMLEHCARLDSEELARELPGFGHPSVHDQLVHIAEAELFWFRIAQGLPWLEIKPADYSDVPAIRELHARANGTARDYLTGLEDAQLHAPVRVEWEPGDGVEISPALMVSHLITHGFHHKGQVVAMCRLLGYPPPETDMDSNIGRE